MDIITGTDLASYPGLDASLTSDQLDWIAAQVNGLVTSAWACPVEPVPAWVTAVALNAAARFAQNPKGLESWTRSVDDASRTERTRSASADQAGIYLTDAERARLACVPGGVGVGTIRTWPTADPRYAR